jgi:RimJ/RimL family protein N-acetyltransferase
MPYPARPPRAGAVWAPEYPIETARLRLRPHRPDDLDDMIVFHSDPEVTRYIPWPVETREQTREALAKRLSQGTARAVGEWLVLAMEESATGTVIGEVLLKRSDDRKRIGELGYAMRTDRQGAGLASEAVAAMLALGFGTFGLAQIVALVEPPNEASRRLLERFGFKRDPSIDEDDVIGFRLDAPGRSVSARDD